MFTKSTVREKSASVSDGMQGVPCERSLQTDCQSTNSVNSLVRNINWLDPRDMSDHDVSMMFPSQNSKRVLEGDCDSLLELFRQFIVQVLTMIELKVKGDHHTKFSNLSNWKEEAWKKSGLQRDLNPWPPRYRCDALPAELWSHTLGARSIYWAHIFPCSKMLWSLYEIIHICTAVVDESEMWSSQ